jgi:hypothetical protein
MKILPEYCYEYNITDISDPITPEYSWFYDAGVNDFLMRPIMMLEETSGPTVTAKINTELVQLPASWYMLIIDDETKAVDTVQITQCANSAFRAFAMHPKLNRFEMIDVQLLDINYTGVVVHLTVPRMNLICCPIGKTQQSKGMPMNVLVGPTDVGKYMNNMTAPELLM